MNTRLLYAVFAIGFAMALIGVSNSHAQETMETTDDNRKVPIPPRDYSSSPVLVLRGGTLLPGKMGSAIANSVIVVRGDRIVSAGKSGEVEVPKNPNQVIDTTGLFLTPGLIDLHVHFTQYQTDDFSRYRDSEAAAAIRGTILAKQLINAGITTVRDAGTEGDVALKIKEAVERRLIRGPRVLWSGQMIATRGGHGDEKTAVGSGKTGGERADIRVANGPWEWRLAVREQIRQQADWIKLTAPFTREEVEAAVDEAHMHEIPVAVDAFGKYTLWASEAGVDTLEHPLNMSEEIVRAMSKNGTSFVPTLTAFYNLLQYGYPGAGIQPGGFYYTMSRRFKINHEQHVAMVREARKLGVPIGVGTDIPFENDRRYPQDYYVELELLKQAGLSDAELLDAATSGNAKILKLSDKVGTVAEGMLADIIALAKDPRADIQNLRDVRLVVADGDVILQASSAK